MTLSARLLRLPVHVYRLFLAQLIPGQCRYLPSCSEYALEALERHGAVAGSWLTVKRFCRCHPWGGHGLDPVPPLARAPGATDISRSPGLPGAKR